MGQPKLNNGGSSHQHGIGNERIVGIAALLTNESRLRFTYGLIERPFIAQQRANIRHLQLFCSPYAKRQ